MKWRFLKPIILQFVNALLLYIGIPLILVFTDLIDINVYSNIGVGLIIIEILLYLQFVAIYLIPGIYSLFDLITNNFVTKKMIFINGYVDKSKFLVFNKKKNNIGSLSVNEYCFFKIIFADQNGKSIYNTTYFFSLEKNKYYTVQYGKFSKVITSILSDEGKEMLQYDFS